jgi:hypothetical protein
MSNLRPVLDRHVRVRPLWRMALALVLVTLVILALGGAIDPLQSGVLTMLPALALATAMLARPYLGERAIARLRARRSRPRRGPGVAPMSGGRPRPRASLARGGCLIATALAGRAPPPALAGAS